MLFVELFLSTFCYSALAEDTTNVTITACLVVVDSGKYFLPQQSSVVPYNDGRRIRSIIDCAGLCMDSQAIDTHDHKCHSVGFVKRTRVCTFYHISANQNARMLRIPFRGKSNRPVYASLHCHRYILFTNCDAAIPRQKCNCEAKTYKGIRCTKDLFYFPTATLQKCLEECSIYFNCHAVSFSELRQECSFHGDVANDMTMGVKDGTYVPDFDSTFAFLRCKDIQKHTQKDSCDIVKYAGIQYDGDMILVDSVFPSLNDCIQYCITYSDGPCYSVTFYPYDQKCVLHTSAINPYAGVGATLHNAAFYATIVCDGRMKVNRCDIIKHEGNLYYKSYLHKISQTPTFEECIDHCSEYVNCRGANFIPSEKQCFLYDAGIIHMHQQTASYSYKKDPTAVHAYVKKCENQGTTRIHNCDVTKYAGMKYGHNNNGHSFGGIFSLERCISICMMGACWQCPGVTYNGVANYCFLHTKGYSSDDPPSDAHVGVIHASITCRDPVPIKPTPQCGVPDDNHSPSLKHRIINGQEVLPHSWPWQLSVTLCESNTISHGGCGGILLPEKGHAGSSSIVMTVAHCLFYTNEKKEEIPYQLDQVHVIAGKHNLNVYEGEQRRRAKAIAIHYAYNTTTDENDIALILVDRPFIYTDRVRPVCLPDVGEDIPLKKKCIATGWGRNSSVDPSSSSETLQQLVLSAYSDKKCKEIWKAYFHEQKMMCARANYNARTSRGDSGGPIQCYDKDKSVWKAYGLDSFGSSKTLGWGPTWLWLMPTVFTRVSYYLNWMEDTLHDLIVVA